MVEMKLNSKNNLCGRPVMPADYPIVPINSTKFNEFINTMRVINKYWIELDQIGACTRCWQLLDKELLEVHRKADHECIPAARLSNAKYFLGTAKKYYKVNEQNIMVCLPDVNQIPHLMAKMQNLIQQEKAAEEIKIQEENRKKRIEERHNRAARAEAVDDNEVSIILTSVPKTKHRKLAVPQTSQPKSVSKDKNIGNEESKINSLKSEALETLNTLSKRIEKVEQKQTEYEKLITNLAQKIESNNSLLNLQSLLTQKSIKNIIKQAILTDSDFITSLSTTISPPSQPAPTPLSPPEPITPPEPTTPLPSLLHKTISSPAPSSLSIANLPATYIPSLIPLTSCDSDSSSGPTPPELFCEEPFRAPGQEEPDQEEEAEEKFSYIGIERPKDVEVIEIDEDVE